MATMIKSPHIRDKTRASRDGHEFHEAWAARLSLRLVLKLDGLVGIAVEGLSPADQLKASHEAVGMIELIAELWLLLPKSESIPTLTVPDNPP